MNKKNILYVGSHGTSGYAISTKNFIFNYLMNGYNVTYIPLEVDNSNKNDNDIITKTVNECINKKYDKYDYFIFNFIPDEFVNCYNRYTPITNNPNCKRILQTVWETTKIPTGWISFLNDPLCDEIWLPSHFNKSIFEKCGVTTPIKVKKYLSYNYIDSKTKSETIIPNNIKYGNKSITETYNFYYIATWNDRKNNINTIKTFCETFTDDDNVSLLMKTNDYEYNSESKSLIKDELESILKNYPNHPTIVWFPDNYSTEQISEIHNLGDCYYLLHRGEGLGYSSYDAYINYKLVIVTGFGGHTEYFSNNYPYLVDYKLIKVFGMKSTGFYQHDHEWAEPDYNHAKYLLRKVYENNNNNCK